MKFQNTAIALTAALAGTTTASPVKMPSGSSFTIRQVGNPSFRPHGPTELAKVYAKYGMPIPEGLAQSVAHYKASKRDHGSTKNTPETLDKRYLTPVKIGTPPQVLNVDLDTGSSDFWVFGKDTPQRYVHGQTLYDPGCSSTAERVQGATWNISYGDGSSSSGIVYRDVVNFGGISFDSQAVEVATNVSALLVSDPDNDGLIGMGFGIINQVAPKKEKTFFENIAPSLDIAAFTVDLKYHVPGSFDFGIIDPAKYDGEITYGVWEFNATIFGEEVTGAADTGTSLLLLPGAITKEYYAQVDGAEYDKLTGYYEFPCDSHLADFTFSIGGANITIPADQLNFSTLPWNKNYCIGGIQPSTIGISIFGDVALKAAFVVFDVSTDSPRLGWASKHE